MRYFLFVFLISLGCSGEEQTPVSDGTLRIGYYERTPFQHRNEDNQAEGLDIDLMRAILNQAKLQYTFVEMPWKRILHMIRLGSIDVGMSAAILSERQEYAHFSKEVFRLGQNALFVRSEDIDKFRNIKHLTDLKKQDFKLGVVRGVAYSHKYEAMLQEDWFQSRLVTVDDKSRPIELLLRKRVDGYLDSEFGGMHRIVQDGKGGQVKHLINLMKLEEAKGYLMFSKKTVSPELVARINAAMVQLKANGDYESIFNKYHLEIDIETIR